MADHAETKTAEIPSSAAKPSGTASVPAAKPPSKPGADKAGAEAPPDRMRRRVIWTAIGGYLGINFLMFLRFFFPRALYEPNTVFSIGFPSDFSLGVNQEFLVTNRVWVIKEPDRLFVVYAVCTHLGCTPEWKPAENKFKCPCHGSGYYITGVNFEGPTPRPLERFSISKDADGYIVVDMSKVYRSELGEWDNPESFISLA